MFGETLRVATVIFFLVTSLTVAGTTMPVAGDSNANEMTGDITVETNKSLEGSSVYLFDSEYEYVDEATVSNRQAQFDDVDHGRYFLELYTTSGEHYTTEPVDIDGATTVSIGSDETEETDQDEPSDEQETNSSDEAETTVAVDNPLDTGFVYLFDADYDHVDDTTISDGQAQFDDVNDGEYFLEFYTASGEYYAMKRVDVDGATTISIGADETEETEQERKESDEKSMINEMDIRAIYVWGYASSIATDDDAQARFFDRVERYDYNTIYLSADVLYDTPDDELAAFLDDAHARGLDVEALVGTNGAGSMGTAYQYTEDVIAYNSDRPDVERFDGIHYDIEPESSENVEQFLTEYTQFLDGVPETGIGEETVSSQGLTVASDIGWWWARDAPNETRELVERDALNYISVMAYYHATPMVEERLSLVVSDVDTSYILAVETMEYPGTNPNNPASFYEEGPDAMQETVDSIAADPPSDGYLGTAYHFYGSSISNWDAIRDASLRTDRAEPGEEVTVETTVLFDNDFPDSAQESQLVVQFEGDDDTYSTEAVITPSAGEPATETSSWDVPSDVSPGEYRVSVTLLDTVHVDEDREAIATRSDPVELDRTSVGTVSIDGNGSS